MRYVCFALSCFAFSLSAVALDRLPPDDQQVVYVFDVDDNMLFMPTQIHLFERATGRQLAISTGRYAEVREQIGVGRGYWSRYEMRYDQRTGSLRDFFDVANPQLFREHLRQALDARAFGRSWPAWQRALSHPTTAANTHVLSARGHRRRTFLAGARDMQRYLIEGQPLIQYLPLLDNLHFVGAEPDIPAAKAGVLFTILDGLQARGITERMWEITHRNGTGFPKHRYHLWGFSDDDIENINRAVELIGTERRAHPRRWSNVKLFFYYTGPNLREMKKGAYVMKDDGRLRKPLPAEFHEGRDILAAQSCQKILVP